MDYFTIRKLITSPAIRLLRKDSAGFVVHFLYCLFREEERFFISLDEMKIRLKNNLEEIQEEFANGGNTLVRDSDFYINDWVSGGFLYKRIKILDNREEIVLEPSPELSKVFFWMEDLSNLDKKEVVGTESRFFSILHKLKELVEESETDPETKIQRLEAKKQEIEDQISRIRSTGEVDILSEERIRGQYLYAKKEALELISDFKQVEINFSEIRQNIHKKYLATSLKGEILEYVLNEDMELMNSEQGRSFQTFWDFLRSDKNQEEWNILLQKLYSLENILSTDEDMFFKKLRRILRDAGGLVNSTVSGLSEQLKRSLVERTLRENRRSKELITEIKNLVMNKGEEDFSFMNEEGWSMEEWDSVSLPMERPLWKGETSQDAFILEPDRQEEYSDWADLISVFQGLDMKQLEENILSLLRYKPEVNLQDILNHFPEPSNLESLVAYLWIASNDERHVLPEDSFFEWENPEKERRFRIPQAVYKVSK
ncbi:MAG: DUF3375 domain-containing protein [Leptospira sp.]|nr:DUF3375 domain-containing protein [Leptospira sp.]